MPQIRILPDDVAAKIAAGEVVERPASVIKELVENSIDAGARTIRVEIQKGGKRLLRVMDDGCGIPAEQVPVAFARHATSKLTSIDDLYRVSTLGFRGEALASIAAVSQLTLVSRPASQEAATRIRIDGAHQMELGASGSPAGTIISVENLFYNVPARLKFLKADATESGHIYKVVAHYALAYPHIRFSLQTDTRTTVQSNGSGELLDAIVGILGADPARQMIPVGDPEEAVEPTKPHVYGYVGSPALHRGVRDQIIFFVNRRWIQDRSLNQAVIQAYHTFLPVGRYPVAILNIDLDPGLVDVNVHPTKAEVKFQNSREIFSVVQRVVRAAVVAEAPIPSYQASGANGGAGNGGSAPKFDLGGRGSGGSRQSWNQFAQEMQETLPLPDTNGDGSRRLMTSPKNAHEMPMMRVIGQVQQMYIIAEGPDGLYMIDQHAAHERVLYDQMMAQQDQIASQKLLAPVTVDLTPGQTALLEAEQQAIAHAGFEVESFGGHTYRLRALPELLSQSDPAQTFIDLLDAMLDGAIPLAKETHNKIAMIVCKRASIKGGQILSPEEMRELVRQLEGTSAPRTCPHGRPTMIHLSMNELGKLFGRH